MQTPIGPLTVEATSRGIAAVSFGERRDHGLAGSLPFLDACVKQLQEYFAGERRTFNDLPLVLRGTDFQSRVWEQTLAVDYGFTATYGSIAEDIGEQNAARAVGNALNKNPLCIIVPCHRIVGANEDSGGYAGGMERKSWLLCHEAKSPLPAGEVG